MKEEDSTSANSSEDKPKQDNSFSFGLFDTEAKEKEGKGFGNFGIYIIAVVGAVLLIAGTGFIVSKYIIRTEKPKSRIITAIPSKVNPFMEHEKRVLAVAISPDGKLLASGSADTTVNIYNFQEDRKPILNLKGHKMDITSVAFSPDGKMLASASDDRNVKLWDVQTGNQIANFEHKISTGNSDEYSDVSAKSVAFSPDGKYLASGGSDGNVILWDVESKQLVRYFNDYYWIWTIAFAPDGKTLASSGEGSAILIWNVENGKQMKKIAEDDYQDAIYSIAYSPDGNTIVSGGRTGRVMFWDVERAVRTIDLAKLLPGELDYHKNAVVSVAFSPKNMLVASASYEGKAKLWDGTRGAVLKNIVFKAMGLTHKITAASFTPDGTKLALGDAEGKTMLYDISDTLE